MADGSATARIYWAAEPDIKKLAPRVLERFAWWMSLLQRSGRLGKMRNLLSAYYGAGIDGQRDSNQLRDAGEDGEVTDLHINQVRPVVNNTLSLIAGVDPVVKARAKNADAKTLAQTRLAEALLASYDTSIASKEREIDCVRGALLASSWNLGQAWLPQDGKEWTKDPEGKPVYEGDIDLFVLPPWRAVYDFAAADEAKRKWALFYRHVSRYDTAAQFEELDTPESKEVANKLRNHVESGKAGDASKYYGLEVGSSMSQLDVLLGESLPQEDVLWVWELRHLPSPALPQGRLIRFVEPDIVLWDSLKEGVAYPYTQLHLFEYSPERVVTGAAGHTGAFDLGALQQFLDLCSSSIATTVNINGQMNLWSPDEGPPNVKQLSTGNSVLLSKSEPKPLMFPALKKEVLEASDWAESQTNRTMALNDVVMGQPDKGMPASAQALQRAQAMQFHAVAQAERVRLRSRNANGKLELLKRFARSPRQVEIAGKARAYEMQEWQADDLADVVRFDVEPINPTSDSFEGRQATLEMLIQFGTIKDGTSALTFLQTGSLEAVTQTQTAQRELVEANVALLQKGVGPQKVDFAQTDANGGTPVFIEDPPGPDGKPAPALRIYKSDPHHLAIPAYQGVLASPASRADAEMVKACTEAIQLSLLFWQSLLPDEAAAYGIPPLPSQSMAGMMPPAPSDAPPDAPPGDGPPAIEGPAENVDLPKPPPNPISGEQEGAGATGLPQ